MTERSKSLFIEAFLRLARNKSIDSLSVTEIATVARTARRTFYRHYTGIDDLARQAMRALGRSFASSLPRAKPLTPNLYSESIFAFWEANFALLENIGRSKHATMLLTEWMEGAGEAVHNVSLESVEDNCAAKYLMKFMAGGLVSTLLAWTADENRPPAATMARIVCFPMQGQ